MISSPSKAFLLLVLATGPVTNAQSAAESFEKLPACAKLCVIQGYQSMHDACAQTDAACFCRNTSFINTTRSCYASSCSGDDLDKAHAWGLSSCAQAGVTLSPVESTANPPTPAKGAKSSASVLVSSAGLIAACALMASFLSV